MVFVRVIAFLILSLCAVWTNAANEFLAPDQAFKFQATSLSEQTVELKWDVVPHYYLYHDQFKVSQAQKPLSFKLPAGQEKDDPTFGLTRVHYGQVTTQIQVKPNQQYQITWQGCAEDGLCYPIQRQSIQTDADGLLSQHNLSSAKGNLLQQLSQNNQATLNSHPADINNSQSSTNNQKQEKAALNTETTKELKQDQKATVKTPQTEGENAVAEQNATNTNVVIDTAEDAKPSGVVVFENSNTTDATANSTNTETASSSSLNQQWNNDQFFLNLLSGQGLLLNAFIFLGFGVLLAFLPCSLPLIPILSGILVQRNTGYKAAAIAITFVVSMALVYGVMGVVASQIGYSIQRWFQNPVVIAVFAMLFVVFALNLFGLYQLSLPQAVLQRLDRIQQYQKGGTLFSAAVMGVISALIVGPCMSAPLAGALLYVSHLDQAALGGLYLFLLGLGMGIPLLIASVFGAKYLPKPGLWMERLKFSFGFIMLAMALYFARPLLATTWYYVAFAVVLFAFAAYLIAILRHVMHRPHRFSLLALSAVIASSGIWHVNQSIASVNAQVQASQLQNWIKVQTEQELNAALVAYANQNIVIDVYADWCVACQPIERDVIPRTDVQDALKNVVRIKLDLTEQHPSQDALLKKWQILGPPTMLFLGAQRQEQRDLRLTGTFNAPQLIQNIHQLSEVSP
ncbi:protein-disulfide reductase DsbD [Acinetobacter towneri]|uniref:protein-disulfide reductase DsbD n=1 Tax=Acinetobacter towneri TaxID=202956 RepID=UPI00188BCF79|nr:protein-disulfide reductase DsbD [Acinetobacter towneri]MBF4521010.1 protein-disulfide reductase DsbD [Acinetobacter towneri]